MRAVEPMIAELYGDWLYIDTSKSKGHQPTEDTLIRKIEGYINRDAIIQR